MLNRRDFLRATATASGGILASSGVLSSFPETAGAADWAPTRLPKFVLHNLRLFDGSGSALQRDRMVVIEEGRIIAVEPAGSLEAFRSYKTVDLGGRTLLPGLIDNHVHLTVPFMSEVNLGFIAQKNRQFEINFRNCLMSGVTTVRDIGAFPGVIEKYRGLADANEIPGPHVISALSPIAARNGDEFGAPSNAPYFTNPLVTWFTGGNYAERPSNVEEIEEACDRMIALGAQWLKTLYQDHTASHHPRPLPNHSDEGYRAILAKGREAGIKCALHVHMVNGFEKGIELGFHTIEHMPMDAIIPNAQIEAFVNRGMAIMPTMLIHGDSMILDELLELLETRGADYLVPEAIEQTMALVRHDLDLASRALSESESRALDHEPKYYKDTFVNVVANLKNLHRMGANVGIGTDLGNPWTQFFGRYKDDLQHFAAAGIPNADILRRATSLNAEIIDMQDEIGSITKGRRADLIAVTGDPLADLNALEAIDVIVKGGIFVKADGIALT